MPNKTFFWFFLPTGLAMILFIGLPIISTGIQSFYAQHDQVVKEVKKCDPFGCTVSIVVDNELTTKLREDKPLGKFNGFGTYVDRNHLAIDEIKKFWKDHTAVIKRFHRYPHRNKMLGRRSTDEEIEFLSQIGISNPYK